MPPFLITGYNIGNTNLITATDDEDPTCTQTYFGSREASIASSSGYTSEFSDNPLNPPSCCAGNNHAPPLSVGGGGVLSSASHNVQHCNTGDMLQYAHNTSSGSSTTTHSASHSPRTTATVFHHHLLLPQTLLMMDNHERLHPGVPQQLTSVPSHHNYSSIKDQHLLKPPPIMGAGTCERRLYCSYLEYVNNINSQRCFEFHVIREIKR